MAQIKIGDAVTFSKYYEPQENFKLKVHDVGEGTYAGPQFKSDPSNWHPNVPDKVETVSLKAGGIIQVPVGSLRKK